MQQEELSEGTYIDINEENGCNEKEEDIPEEGTLAKNFILKDLLTLFHDIENAKDKMLARDPDLERNMQSAEA